MIRFAYGDLLDTPFKYIAHGCNDRGVMGSGIAKQIREKYPEAYLAYRESWLNWNRMGCQMPLGSSSRSQSGDKLIYNLVTQQNYGRDGKKYVSYDAIDRAFTALRQFIPARETLAVPKIGCGLGGGCWEIVREILNHASEGYYDIIVYQGKIT
jgi:O-acetyl-ADP-ribose deacetylase (regulator of RNase III)